MKVILRKDVEKLGAVGDVVNVSDGYARNFLVPRGMAYLATDSNLKRVEDEKRQLAKQAVRTEELAREKAETLGGTIPDIHGKGDGGRPVVWIGFGRGHCREIGGKGIRNRQKDDSSGRTDQIPRGVYD